MVFMELRMPFEEKVAIVTGAGQGIGKAICLAMAREGIRVAVTDIKASLADRVERQIKDENGIASSFQADVRNEDQIKSMVDNVLAEFGRIDFLINNAGIVDQNVPTIEQDTSKWQDLIDIHLRGTYLCSKEVGKHMVNARSGRIINIGSIAGFVGVPFRTAYGPAKSAIIMLTKILAIEWAQFNINVNAIAPGYTRTEMLDNLIRAGKVDEKVLCNRIPLGRFGTTEELAGVALFLLSDVAGYITGETILVDGGWVAYGST